MSAKTGETFTMAADDGQLSFSAFVLGLASSALIHLGAHENPETGTMTVDLVLARQSIDVLAMLREKTRGNLTADEEHLFNSVLADLRLRFVEKSNAKA
ncbi:MAG TPA: DUF1844 domain-containing protein [Archangium sp.]|jgi:hypothetical protein